ncbi:MAG: TonB-dependent receptor [Myxococcales bacterium]|nr:TonB-dependent receptor [Myxococcales bacterium]
MRLAFKLVLLVSWVLFPTAALAQVSLNVTVLDAASREAIAGIRVDLANETTGTTLSEVTNDSGQARFGGLETGGAWVATTERTERYEAASSEPLSLRSRFEQSLTLLVRSEAGSAPTDTVERVTVEGDRISPRLNTTSAEVSSTLRLEEFQRLPIQARNLENLLFRLPFVVRSTGFFPEAPAAAVNGANALFTNYTIDGLDNNENFLGGQRFPVQLGLIQDVTVLAANYSVEYGRTSNGIVNVTTRSGGNELDGAIYFVTRPGLNADVPSLGREREVIADLQGNPVGPDFQRYQWGASLGGPIVRDQTFFFFHGEYLLDLTDNRLSVPALGVEDELRGDAETVLLSGRLDHYWSPRWSSTLRINHGRVHNEDPGGGVVGGNVFPGAGTQQERLSTNIALSSTYRADDWDYTGAVQYSRFDWDYRRPVNGPGPQVNLQNEALDIIAVLGHPGFVFDETENTVQTQHKFELEAGPHRFKWGADIIVADFSLQGGGNVDGNRVVRLTQAELDELRRFGSALSPADVQSGLVVSEVFETSATTFGTHQELYALYAEDLVQITPDLSLRVGVRWDYDSLSTANGVADGDFDNFAPRAGFNWSVLPNLVIRGGAGFFYEKIPYAIVSDAIQQSSRSQGFRDQLAELQRRGIIDSEVDLDSLVANGNFGVQAIDQVPNPAGGVDFIRRCEDRVDCFARREELNAGELRIQNPDGLDNPFTVQSTLGVQWQFLPALLTSVDIVYSEGYELIRLVDLNAPGPFEFNQALFDELGPEGVAALSQAEREELGLVRSRSAADQTRPVNPATPGGARSIIISDTGGRSRYLAMNLALFKDRGTDFYDFSLFYTLSRLENDTDDINFRASNSNDFDAEWAPSLNDRTHAFSALVSFYPFRGATLSLAGLLQSGTPVNFVPDPGVFGVVDINGDGLSIADQFTGNPDRAPGFDRNSGRLDWSFNLDVHLEYSLSLFGDSLVMAADVFNLLNLNNQSGYPVNFTSSNSFQTAGQPFEQRSADIPLTAQFSLDYRF